MHLTFFRSCHYFSLKIGPSQRQLSDTGAQTSLYNASATAGTVASSGGLKKRKGWLLSLLFCSALALLFYKQAGSLQNHMLGNDESCGCIPCMSWDA